MDGGIAPTVSLGPHERRDRGGGLRAGTTDTDDERHLFNAPGCAAICLAKWPHIRSSPRRRGSRANSTDLAEAFWIPAFAGMSGVRDGLP